VAGWLGRLGVSGRLPTRAERDVMCALELAGEPCLTTGSPVAMDQAGCADVEPHAVRVSLC
jgi:hypothetical protein